MPNYSSKAQARITESNQAELDRVREKYGESATPESPMVNPAGRNHQEAVAFQRNMENPLQSNLERNAERRSNFYYGGDENYGQEQMDRTRQSQQESADRFGAVSGRAQREADEMSGRASSAATRAPGQFIDKDVMLQDRLSGRRQENVYDSLMSAGRAPAGPSAAQSQLQMGTNSAMQDQLALARSGRGMGQSQAGMQAAAANMGSIQQTASNQSAMLRAQEDAQFRDRQLQAYGAAGGVAAQQRGQNLATGQYTTGTKQAAQALSDQTALAYEKQAADYNQQNLQSAQAQSGADIGYYGMQGSVAEGISQGNQAYEDNLMSRYIGQRSTPKSGGKSALESAAPYIQMGATALAFSSDVREKTEIAPAEASTGLGGWLDGAAERYGDYQSRMNLINGFTQPMTASDIRAKTDVAPAQAGGAFDMRAAHGDPQSGREGTPSAIERDRTVDKSLVGKSRGELQAMQDQIGRAFSGEKSGDYHPSLVGRSRDQLQEIKRQLDGMALDAQDRAPALRQSARGKSDMDAALDAQDRAPASKALAEAPAYSYRYKDPDKFGYEDKRYTGPMAQDLAATPEGASAVVEKPDGSLGVDTGRLSLLTASAFGEQQDELESIKREVAAMKTPRRNVERRP